MKDKLKKEIIENKEVNFIKTILEEISIVIYTWIKIIINNNKVSYSAIAYREIKDIISESIDKVRKDEREKVIKEVETIIKKIETKERQIEPFGGMCLEFADGWDNALYSLLTKLKDI